MGLGEGRAPATADLGGLAQAFGDDHPSVRNSGQGRSCMCAFLCYLGKFVVLSLAAGRRAVHAGSRGRVWRHAPADSAHRRTFRLVQVPHGIPCTCPRVASRLCSMCSAGPGR